MKELQEYTNLELLRELLSRDVLIDAASKSVRHIPHKSLTIGIGCDHTAEVILATDSLLELVAYKHN